MRAWRERPLDEEYYAVFLDGTFLSIRRGKIGKEPMYMGNQARRPPGDLNFGMFGAEGESTKN